MTIFEIHAKFAFKWWYGFTSQRKNSQRKGHLKMKKTEGEIRTFWKMVNNNSLLQNSHGFRGAIGQRVRLLTERLVVQAHPGACFSLMSYMNRKVSIQMMIRMKSFESAALHKNREAIEYTLYLGEKLLFGFLHQVHMCCL